ncbi:MAG: hypothetical protein RLZZ455_755 [Candidatus Parcubacteria bacterium]|jgi:hypothetical protein
MELHDIRYLHDESLPEDDELGADFVFPSFVTKKNILSLGVILFLITSIGVVTFNLANRTTTTSTAAGTGENQQEVVQPTPKQIEVKGKITCLESETVSDGECEIAIQTDKGEIYTLENVQYADVVSGAIVPGKVATVVGTVVQSSGSGASSGTGGSSSGSSGGSSSSVDGTIYIATPGNGSSQPTSPPQPTATPTITLTPTPTPLPFSIPTPAVNYLTVKYIVDNKETLVGKDVPLGAYIVSTQQPDPDCPQGEDCSRVQFIVNDAVGSSRDSSYDTLLLANTTSEGEILFTPGQNIYASVTVVVNEDVVSLLLNILD